MRRSCFRKIDLSKVDRDIVKQDIEFYQALCGAKLALNGTGEDQRGRQPAQRFCPQESAKLPLLGGDRDDGRLAGEQREIRRGAKAVRGAGQRRRGRTIRCGPQLRWARTLQAQDKHAEAIQQFDAVLAMADDSDSGEGSKAFGDARQGGEPGRHVAGRRRGQDRSKT